MTTPDGLAITISSEDTSWDRAGARSSFNAYYIEKMREALSTPGTIVVRVTVEKVES